MSHADPEKAKEYWKTYREKNREAYNARMREWYRTPAGRLASQRNYERQKAKRAADPNINRALKLRHRYGISIEQYEEMLDRQEGVCAICRGVSQDKRRMHVDHNHATGQVREILCASCNQALGLLAESEERAQSLLAYIRKWNP